ncbi:MAG: hypothetical protein RJA44_1922, partial [Pseudomonadota bacterium]
MTPRRLFHRAPPGSIRLIGAAALLAFLAPLQAQTSAALDAAEPLRYRPVLPTPVLPPALPQVLDGMLAANARVGRISVEVRGAGAPADGVTPVVLTVKVHDHAGELLKEPVLLTIEHSGSARLQLPGAPTDEFGPSHKDADRRVPGTQLLVPAGEASFSLIAPSQPEEVQLRLSAGAAWVDGSIDFEPDLREMVAAGLIEGVLRLSRGSGNGVVQPAQLADGFETELTQWSRSVGADGRLAARSALFLKGRISGSTLLTLSYDSDKDTRVRLLSQIRPEEFYPVYGDASVKGFEAPSASKLYVRVDRGRDFVLWGDFASGEGFAPAAGAGLVAGSRLRQLGAYSRSLTGVRLHTERSDGFANLYASRDTLRQQIDEIRANGTSGPFAISVAQALEQSEKVELLVRDRNHLDTILSVTPLVRLNDYSFEPFSGRILLARPVPSLDASGNPISLRITYEADQGGTPFWVAGTDGQFNLGGSLTLGGSLVEDRNPDARFRLASVNAGARLGEATTLVAEAARTDANLTTVALSGAASLNRIADPGAPSSPGQASRLVLEHKGERLEARLYTLRASSGFANGGAGVQPGTRQLGAGLGLQVTEPLRLKAELQQTGDLLTEARRNGLSLGADLELGGGVQLSSGLRRIEESGRLSGAASSLGANPSAGSFFSGGGFSGAGSSTLLNLNGPGLLSGAAPGSVPDLASTTAFAGARWKLDERISLQAQHEQSVQGDPGHRSELGASYQWAERSRLYARGERQVGLASRYGLDPAARSTVGALGIDGSYMQGGQVFSEYRLRDASGSERAAQLASGLRNAWMIDEGLMLSTGLERLRVLSGIGQDASAATAGLDYSADPLWKASGRLEWRRLDGASLVNPANGGSVIVQQDSYLSTLTLARKLDRDWSVLTRNYYLTTDNHGALANGWQDRFQLGAAYRPVDDNRFDLLGKYEYKVEDNISAQQEWRRVHVGALQT